MADRSTSSAPCCGTRHRGSRSPHLRAVDIGKDQRATADELYVGLGPVSTYCHELGKIPYMLCWECPFVLMLSGGETPDNQTWSPYRLPE